MKVRNFLKALRDYFNGDFAYQNYLEHAKNHPDEKVLSKDDFLRKKNLGKWNRVSRCC